MKKFNHPCIDRGICPAKGRRKAFTLIEILVAMSLLLVVMSVCGKLIYQTDLVWRETSRHRVAMDELSNQMEQLTLLSADDLQARLDSITPSRYCQQTLSSSDLTADLVDDELGTRLILRLNWKRKHPGKPVQLVGWLAGFSQAETVNPPVDAGDSGEGAQ